MEEGIALLACTYRPGCLTMLECRFNKTTHHVIIIMDLLDPKSTVEGKPRTQPASRGAPGSKLCLNVVTIKQRTTHIAHQRLSGHDGGEARTTPCRRRRRRRRRCLLPSGNWRGKAAGYDGADQPETSRKRTPAAKSCPTVSSPLPLNPLEIYCHALQRRPLVVESKCRYMRRNQSRRVP